jgi:negative regulator of flagellin synthesis FlgM
MKVYDNKAAALPEIKRPEKSDKKGPPGASGSGDVVALSSRALEMREAEEAARNAPDIRAEKVKVLKGAVESGTYNVRGTDVADKMIRPVIDIFS